VEELPAGPLAQRLLEAVIFWHRDVSEEDVGVQRVCATKALLDVVKGHLDGLTSLLPEKFVR
jgi:hypothetical protein